MKKLLTILGSVGLVATTSAAVIACGDKTPNAKQPTNSNEKPPNNGDSSNPSESDKDKKPENTKPTEESKKEEKEKAEEKIDSLKNDKDLGNFEPDKRNILPQATIRETVTKKLGISPSELQKFEVDYEKKRVKVISSKSNNQEMEFTFTSFLDLGTIQNTIKDGRSYTNIKKIKEAISKKMGVKEDELKELDVNTNDTGTVRSTKFSGTLAFKFSSNDTKK
ncbi:lipoprotein [Mycoplasma mycoides subsp. capri]|uniref:lipoprotein n=1 Tax=Mycoplasma mycoides TaxID=2102 RepID=UPI00223F206A|nr:lipoprotein [Mycoplasma mycoides]UZK64303.1 lipoprotein [Mycoplasma mycoides subsp. capri]